MILCRITCPERDLGLYSGSTPAILFPFHISHQALLQVSLLHQQTLPCRPEHICVSYSRMQLVAMHLTGFKRLARAVETSRSWTFKGDTSRALQCLCFENPSRLGTKEILCISERDGIQVQLAQLGSISELRINSPARVGPSPCILAPVFSSTPAGCCESQPWLCGDDLRMAPFENVPEILPFQGNTNCLMPCGASWQRIFTSSQQLSKPLCSMNSATNH